jgi:hypothetical protein
MYKNTSLRINSSIEHEVLEEFVITNLKLQNEFPPIFIIGNSRSGTTLVYSFLVNYFKFAFFSNATKSNPFAAILNSLRAADDFNSADYSSNYGILNGNYQPSDGWDIFNRFFPKYDLSEEPKYDEFYKLKNIFYFLEKCFDAPVLNKNNMNSIRISHLHQIFPNALFVWVKRDFINTVLSNLKGRMDLKIPKNHWFGMPAPHFYNKNFENEIERVIYRIFSVSIFIKESLIESKANYLTVNYEDFCTNPFQIGQRINEYYEENGYSLIERKLNDVNTFNLNQPNNSKRNEISAIIQKIIDREPLFHQFLENFK